ncbi:hypothetical protein DVH24_033639 [Malus domestica]|uniref:Uncharacterized protein n=1 Tax=Malus domestica TaxID=3750 RepID=A0A498KR26_MALDO|nr:hypothetical protein DVH24_033639 [Malus domestica]
MGFCFGYLSRRNAASRRPFPPLAALPAEDDIVAVLVSRTSRTRCGAFRCASFRSTSRMRNAEGRWVFTASDRPIEALSLDAYDCRARREPSTVKVVGLARAGVEEECYLVDPASSHMLVSKIKPCMCKYEQIQTVKLRMAH